MATHSKTPWTEEPDGLQSMGLQRIRLSKKRLSMHTQLFSKKNWKFDLTDPGAGIDQKRVCSLKNELPVELSQLLMQEGQGLPLVTRSMGCKCHCKCGETRITFCTDNLRGSFPCTEKLHEGNWKIFYTK